MILTFQADITNLKKTMKIANFSNLPSLLQGSSDDSLILLGAPMIISDGVVLLVTLSKGSLATASTADPAILQATVITEVDYVEGFYDNDNDTWSKLKLLFGNDDQIQLSVAQCYYDNSTAVAHAMEYVRAVIHQTTTETNGFCLNRSGISINISPAPEGTRARFYPYSNVKQAAIAIEYEGSTNSDKIATSWRFKLIPRNDNDMIVIDIPAENKLTTGSYMPLVEYSPKWNIFKKGMTDVVARGGPTTPTGPGETEFTFSGIALNANSYFSNSWRRKFTIVVQSNANPTTGALVLITIACNDQSVVITVPVGPNLVIHQDLPFDFYPVKGNKMIFSSNSADVSVKAVSWMDL